MTRELAYFTSQELVRRKFNEAHDRTLSAAKARSIALHVEQGLNFFEASRDVPVSIRPLTQFYGVAALTRAVSLFRSTTLSEEGLTGGHGLSIVDWSAVNGSKPNRGFDAVRVKVSKGLFTGSSRRGVGRCEFGPLR